MLVVAFILTIVGTWFLNQAGSLTTEFKGRTLGFSLNLGALLLFANMYGAARGTFIYLGVWALIGMVMTLAMPYISKQES